MLKHCFSLKTFIPNFVAFFVSLAVADLGEGSRGPGPGPPLLVEYLQKIYKKTAEMSIQKPF